MKILCSGEQFIDPIETDECLECALKTHGEHCGYGYRLLKAIFSSQEDRSDEIHVTDITSCLRKTYLDKTAQIPDYVHKMLVLWLGIAVHNALDYEDDNFQSEVPVEADGIVGRVDAIFGETIEDVKTTRWLDLSKGTYGKYDQQLNIYRQLSGKEGGLRVQQIDFSGPTKCRSCRVPAQKINGEIKCPQCGYVFKGGHLGAVMTSVPVMDKSDIEGFIDERVKMMRWSLENKTQPNAEPGWICAFCKHMSCAYNQSDKSGGS